MAVSRAFPVRIAASLLTQVDLFGVAVGLEGFGDT